MHGRQRAEYKAFQRDPKVAAGMAAKAQKWHALTAEIAQRRQQLRAMTEKDLPLVQSTLLLTEKMLLVNPDPLYLWNFRRDLWGMSRSAEGDLTASTRLMLETDLRVTQAALENNPKSYGAWFHRKWLILQQQGQPNNGDDSLLQQELTLTQLFLQRDERNFHCWNYRRFVVSCLLGNKGESGEDPQWWKSPQVVIVSDSSTMDAQPLTSSHDAILQVEWDFTTSKIQDNFSNFSAFHYRSKLLSWKVDTSGENEVSSIVQNEWELWQNAVFTEPDDQTAWWYARFLLDFGRAYDIHEWYQTLIQEQIEGVRELADEMPGSKWVCLGLNMLLLERAKWQKGEDESKDLWMKLQTLDPDRLGRYKEMMQETNNTR